MGRKPKHKKYEFSTTGPPWRKSEPIEVTPMDLNSKKFKAAVDIIRKRLRTNKIISKDSEVLLTSILKAFRILAHYCRKIKVRRKVFDRKSRKEFERLSPFICTESENAQLYAGLYTSSRDVEESLKLAKNGLPSLTNMFAGSMKEAGTLPRKDPSCFTLRGLKQLVARSTPNNMIEPPLMKGHACRPPLLDPNRILPETNDLPLDEKEQKIWLEFKDFDKANLKVRAKNFKFVEEEQRPIELDHPLVGVIGNFAVAAFNKACEMHVKKGEHKNIHDFEFTECKYLKITKAYCFYMTIEAVEEGNLGVYETKVVCSSDDGGRTLRKFVLTNRTPIGTKAMAISHFSRLMSLCETLEGVTKDELRKMEIIYHVVKGNVLENRKAMSEVARILKLHDKTVKGLLLLFLDTELLFPPDCLRTTKRDGWCHPDDDYYSGMLRRTKGTPCKGYDYFNPFSMRRLCGTGKKNGDIELKILEEY